MKKILLLATIVLILSSVCMAEETFTAESEENTAAIEQTTPDTTEVEGLSQEHMDTEEISLDNAAPEEEDENIFTNDPQTNMELQGFLEYTEPENAVFLEDTAYKSSLNLKAPSKIGSKSFIPSKMKQSQYLNQRSLEAASKFSNVEYMMAPVSTSFKANAGNFSIGTMYDSSLDSTQLSYTTGIFTKYDGKYFAITTAFSKNAKTSSDTYSDKIYFAPELKITKRLSLLDIMQTDVMQTTKKNEVVLRYSPPLKKYADDVQFELGAGQSFSEDKQINSTLRFSTKFRL